MIGQQKPLCTDHFRGATTVEMNHSIFQRTLVDAVNVFRTQVHTHRLHVAFNRIEQCGDPHALFGLRVKSQRQSQRQCKNRQFREGKHSRSRNLRHSNCYCVIQ